METYSWADSQLPTHTDGIAKKSISLFRLIIKCVHPKKKKKSHMVASDKLDFFIYIYLLKLRFSQLNIFYNESFSGGGR